MVEIALLGNRELPLGPMPFGDAMTDDPVVADVRNFYKVELWTRDDCIERMLFAGTSLDKARALFADYARRRPAARLTIRQRSRCSISGRRGDWRR
jgi:hypothetical protein